MYKIARRLLCLVAVFVLMLPAIASADEMTAEQQKALQWPWYSTAEPGSSGSCSVGTGTLPAAVPEPFNGIISKASKKFGSDPKLVAAIFYWENRTFPPGDKTDWATSSAGATGPMQFLQSTFDAYAEDGDGDGKKNINDLEDALYTGARYIAENGGKSGVPLGSLDKPLAPNTLLRVAASYNWGPGNVQDAGENATLANLPEETSDYLKAVFVLVDSNFSQSPQSGNETTPSSDDSAAVGSTSICAPMGEGTGDFTDNTSTTIPGADQAVARAQQIARYNTAQLQAICDGSPNCYQMCERLAAVVWGHTNSGYGSAAGHWAAASSAGKAHPKDRNVPVGALLYYDTGSVYGHVATYLGNNLILSNDVADSTSGVKGGAYIVDASKMEGDGWSLTYLGWVNPVPW